MKKILTAATAAVAAAGGLLVTAPAAHANVIAYGPGTYLISSPIIVPDGWSLQGAGVGETILKAAPGFTGTMITDSGGYRHHPGIQVHDLTIDGSGTAERGFHFYGVDDLVVENVEAYRTTRTALEQRGIMDTPYQVRQTWAHVYVHDCGGWGIFNGLRTRKVQYDDIRVERCRAGGLTIDHSEGQANGVVLKNNGGNGLWIRNVYSVNLNNITVIGNAGYGIFAQATVYSLGTDWVAANNHLDDVKFTNSAPPWANYGVTRGTLVTGLAAGHVICSGTSSTPAERAVTVDPGVDVQIVGQRAATVADAC